MPLLLLFLFLHTGAAAEERKDGGLSSFSDPARIWGNGLERVIEEAYRQSFKTYIIGGRVMNLRMPFAQNHERSELAEQDWEFLGGGKANPASLWEIIGEVLSNGDFLRYTDALSDGREKVIIFDIPTKTWTATRDFFDLSRMKAGYYRGLPHRPYVLVSGQGIEESDVYNYLYCVGWVGMDCSGFVWQILSYAARSRGLNLSLIISRALGIPRGQDPSWYVGAAFFGSNSREIVPVQDEIRNLRPADILLFRGEGGGVVHSAVIQSVNFTEGIVRYLQSTDEAPLDERGAHESFIRFDPAHPEMSLKHPSVVWTQARYAPFPGERPSPFSDDGRRYRAFGGGRVVRLRAFL
ncbi:MAG: peptidoglycan endopeptidase [Treponema sp.]|nr:peptidoglycan endopeptidase [Treponema sp.]